jgi:hypothetical protein
MERIVAGDQAAIFTLYLEFGGHVAALMRRQLKHLTADHAADEDVEAMVIDACLALADVAGGWRPEGGALPWNWAIARLRPIATQWVGQYSDEIDTVLDDELAGSELVDPNHGTLHANDVELLTELASCHEGCALVLEALERVASERDRAIVLELRVQSANGDAAPAVTIANRHGLSAAAVRQVACRVRSRLRQLAADEARFASLADLALVA